MSIVHEIILRSGKVVLIDTDDLEKVSAYAWYATKGAKSNNTEYARTPINGKWVRMHRLIMGVEDKSVDIDHIDGNGLNNTRSNLRLATRSQNSCNRKRRKNNKYLGVFWNPDENKWLVYIRKDGKKYYLGRFTDEKEAAVAYNKKAKELHGEFATLNVIQ